MILEKEKVKLHQLPLRKFIPSTAKLLKYQLKIFSRSIVKHKI